MINHDLRYLSSASRVQYTYREDFNELNKKVIKDNEDIHVEMLCIIPISVAFSLVSYRTVRMFSKSVTNCLQKQDCVVSVV